MKIKFGIYSFLFLLLILTSCGASKQVPYFQSNNNKQGKIVDLPSYRIENTVRFRPDDILAITVNVPGEPTIAADYNLPLVPTATTENSTEDFVSTGTGRQAYLIGKDGTIDYPVIGRLKVAGYTQGELEEYMRERLTEALIDPPIVTVRLLNFKIIVTGEVNSPGEIKVEKDHINLLDALALAGDMTVYGKRDDIRLIRPKPDGGYTMYSLDISKEEIISSPYYFLQQNDEIYVMPVRAKSQNADISPMLNVTMGVTGFVISLVSFVLVLLK